MSFPELLDSYGYLALVIGTFLEGETALILGSIAAQLGFMELPWVIAAALCGTLIGDQFYFFLGRLKGQPVLRKRPKWQIHADKVFKLLQRHETLFILGFRFMYGVRTVASIVIGMSKVSTAKFIILDILGALAWAAIVGCFGYTFGKAFEAVILDIKHYQFQAIGALVVIGTLFWFWQRHYQRKRSIVTIHPKAPTK